MEQTQHAPKRKARDPFWDSRVCAVASLAITLINLLPEKTTPWAGRSLGALAWRLDGYHRRRVLRNMDLAFREEKTPEEKARLCRLYFEHLGLSIFEFARLGKLKRENIGRRVDLSELKTLDELLARGKGLLCVPAHHGNWELCGYAVALKGYPLNSVARPLDNPALNELVAGIRERSGNKLLEKWKVLWTLKKLLDKCWTRAASSPYP
jgi:KDO2-lipid IV(A) lauroyltransferase